ncbi:MAG: serine hydrolase [Candidatus Dormibacteraeota bacterium]|nr:serine hydrolase [Candidatus Dormibacteraeota bacterium]
MATESQTFEEIKPELEERLAEAARRHRVPGAAVGILRGGEEQYACHGVTSIENPLAVDEATLFQIGSTTKTFTATAAMRLAEQGRLSLDATVRTYVPELRLEDESVAERVTVRQLFNHTAGWAGDHFVDMGFGDDALTRYVESMAELEQRSPLGAIASYNNASLCLAGRVIEKVTGTTYEAALTELVLEPLGLAESFFFPWAVMTRRFASGHVEQKDEQQVARPWHLPRTANPAGGLVCSIRDQIRYASFHLGDGTADGKRVLSQATLERMKQATFSLEGGSLGDEVGIAWLLRKIEGVQLVGHGGSTHGQEAAFQMVPERDFAIAVLTNSDRGSILHRELVSWALERYLSVEDREPTPLELPAAALAEYAGDYRSEMGTLTLVVEGDRLVATVSYSEEALSHMRAVFGDQEPEPKPMPLRILPGDRCLVVDGDAKGRKGNFVREEGRITGVNLGGRLAARV